MLRGGERDQSTCTDRSAWREPKSARYNWSCSARSLFIVRYRHHAVGTRLDGVARAETR